MRSILHPLRRQLLRQRIITRAQGRETRLAKKHKRKEMQCHALWRPTCCSGTTVKKEFTTPNHPTFCNQPSFEKSLLSHELSAAMAADPGKTHPGLTSFVFLRKDAVVSGFVKLSIYQCKTTGELRVGHCFLLISTANTSRALAGGGSFFSSWTIVRRCISLSSFLGCRSVQLSRCFFHRG